ncbi:MAG TPA: peptidylprolyl isomerase [Chitinophagaceae bacterium]|nr:peptidylprolyl isomerase [Chitinophagaceae bacterium]
MRLFTFILIAFILNACTKPSFKSKWTTERSPDTFTARFETSKGSFDVQLTREYSPLAVDRVYQLLKHHLYDNTLFYRVVPNFVAQFGIADTSVTNKWGAFIIPDEKVVASNVRGAISFARGGKESRKFLLFINLKDNLKLDTAIREGVTGYPPLGKVIRGMEVVDLLYSGYGEATMKQLKALKIDRSSFLNTFPKLDSIKKAYILRGKK